MRILYLCADPGIPVFGRKGCSTHVRETIAALRALGHDVRLVCGNARGDAPPVGPVREVSAPKSKLLGFDGRHLVLNHRVAAALEAEQRAWPADALYERYTLYCTAGAALARRHLLPRLLELNSFMATEQARRIRLGWLARRVERRVLTGARHLVLVSDGLRPGLQRLNIPEARLTKMPMRVNPDLFHPGRDGAAVRAAWHVPGRLVIGYTGALTGWHGIRLLYELVHALRELQAPPFVVMVMGGEAHKVQANRARAREAGMADTLRFEGSVPYESVADYVRACDVTLVPDATPWSSPTKLFEYMACGVASVAPDLPPVREALEDGLEGLLFPPRDVPAMARQVLRLLNDPALRDAMGRAAHERARRDHAWGNNARGIIDLFAAQGARVGSVEHPAPAFSPTSPHP